MQKLAENTTGNFKCYLYKYSLGYGFKIYYEKKVKGNLLSESYCYYNKKEDCVEAMHNRLKVLIGINKDLLDFDKL